MGVSGLGISVIFRRVDFFDAGIVSKRRTVRSKFGVGMNVAYFVPDRSTRISVKMGSVRTNAGKW